MKMTPKIQLMQEKLNRNRESGKPWDVHWEIALERGNTEDGDLYLPSDHDLNDKEWAPYYKEPRKDLTVINWNHMHMYWYWMSERMSIWYKRVINQEPQPWTDDHTLQMYKFTNVFRDMDKGTIYYINNILKPILEDESVSLDTRKKNLIINTLVYRLFIYPPTVEAIGRLDVNDWDNTWSNAKRNIKQRRAEGKQIFHGAYMVNSLAAAATKETGTDKVLRAINLIENYWYPNIDALYQVSQHDTMEECATWMTENLLCSGAFTTYENLCDWALAGRYTSVPMVKWTDDSWANVGPGARHGLMTIFLDTDMDELQQMVYLRASWSHYMWRYGYLDRFVNQMPSVFNHTINMRVIEHDLCEFSKYLRGHYNLGRLKNTFKNTSSKHMSDLELPDKE